MFNTAFTQNIKTTELLIIHTYPKIGTTCSVQTEINIISGTMRAFGNKEHTKAMKMGELRFIESVHMKKRIMQ